MIVILAGDNSSYVANRLFWVAGNEYLFGDSFGSSAGQGVNAATLSGKTLSWYGVSSNVGSPSAVTQGNKSGIKYNYIAIG